VWNDFFFFMFLQSFTLLQSQIRNKKWNMVAIDRIGSLVSLYLHVFHWNNGDK